MWAITRHILVYAINPFVGMKNFALLSCLYREENVIKTSVRERRGFGMMETRSVFNSKTKLKKKVDNWSVKSILG